MSNLANSLLPAAHIHIYTLSSDLGELDHVISKDWRFGRVKLSTDTGGVDAAIHRYGQEGSPDLLVIETQKMDDGFLSQLEKLGQLCGQNTQAIIIGPVNDIQLYRRLKDIGVSEYYVHPIDYDVFLHDMAGFILQNKGHAQGRLITFIGAKGGVGTSILAQNAARIMAQRADQHCLLLDLGGGYSNACLNLSGQEPSGTMDEVMRALSSDDMESLDRMIISAGERLDVLNIGAEPMLHDLADLDSFDILCDALMSRFANVIIDTAQIRGAYLQMLIRKSSDVVLVTSPHMAALRAARSLLSEMVDIRGGSQDHVAYIVNQSASAGDGDVPLKDIAQAMGSDPAIHIEHDAALFVQMDLPGQLAHHAKRGNAAPILLDEQDWVKTDAGKDFIAQMLILLFGDANHYPENHKNSDKSKNKASGIAGFINKFMS